MLADLNVQDTDYAPAGDMFEIGAKIQVMKKGVFFPARANKLHKLWRNHHSWEEIDEKTRQQIETRYFVHTMRIAMCGNTQDRVNYQVHTGPALGAFNQWVKGTSLENWRNRHVDEIAVKLMQASADLLNQRFNAGRNKES